MKRLLLASLFVFASPSLAEEVVICAVGSINIPDGLTSGLSLPLNISEETTGRVVVSVSVDLEIEHPWIGDLVVRLINPDGATVVDLLARTGTVPYGFPGPFGCGGDDVLALLEDAAADSVEEVCAIGVQPVLAGSLRPSEPLAAFNGLDPEGTWTLLISDRQSGDSGQLISACLRLEVAEDCDGDGVPDACSCVGDLDGDNLVSGADLTILLGAWGSASKNADLDGDGSVGGADLAIMLGAWGSCS